MPPKPYQGAIALGGSKYATCVTPSFAAFPSAAPTQLGQTAIATKKQIEATNNGARNDTNGSSTANMAVPAYNSDAELAIAQNTALKEECDKHAASFHQSITSSSHHIRQLLTTMRDGIKKDSPTGEADLKSLDTVWKEFEDLFEAANEAKVKLPMFMDQQNDNMKLYHDSMMNEALQDTQAELNLQHKKVNLQHNLILEHQQSFQDWKAQTQTKLNKIKDLEERASRLLLDKGLLRTEVDRYKQELQESRALQADNAKLVDSLQKELDSLRTSKKSLEAEYEALRKTSEDKLNDLMMKEDVVKMAYKDEIRALKDQVTQNAQKRDSLQNVLNKLKAGDGLLREENEKIKQKLVELQQNVDHRYTQYEETLAQLQEQQKTNADLEDTNKSLLKSISDIDEVMGRLKKLNKKYSELAAENADFEAQNGKLMHQIREFEAKIAKPTSEVEDLVKKVGHLEKKNADLFAQTKHLDTLTKSLSDSVNENTRLKGIIQEMNGRTLIATTPWGREEDPETQVITKEEVGRLQEELAEWTDLAKRSYEAYHEIQPVYERAQEYHQACEQKDLEIAELNRKLESAKISSGALGPDDGFWKRKYDDLMADL